RKHVVFETGCRRLHPAKLLRGAQKPWRDLAKERVGAGHLRKSLRLIGGVDHGHRPGGGRDASKAFGFNGRLDDELHDDARATNDSRYVSVCSRLTTSAKRA